MAKTEDQKSGHTLVEMTVVVTILAVVMSLVARAQRPFSEMVMELQDRATTSSELHLAVDYLATDFGAALSVERQAFDRILIRREQGPRARNQGESKKSDRGLRYSFKDGQLIRKDQSTREEFVVATGLTGFSVSEERDGITKLLIADGIADDDQHSVTLIWRNP